MIQVIVVGLLTGGVYALLATGLTLIFGVMRVINIAHGAFLIFSAYISYWMFTAFGVDPFLSIFVSVPILFFFGIIFQRHVLSKVAGDPGLGVLLTFALALSLEGLMGSLWESTGRSVRTSYTSKVLPLKIPEIKMALPFDKVFELSEINLRLPYVRIAGLVAAVIALTGLFLILKYSNVGRAIRATIQNRNAAQLVGVNVERIQAITFGFGLATVAGGGALFSLIWTFNSGSHEEWISKMLSVIVLGGMGSLPGAFIAALIMGVVEAVSAVVMTSYISPIVFYLILFITLIFRPQGLMGVRIRKG
ncbi:MAG: branched-chain amino acid ABC transporter permease [Anaerolineae bacterium]|nr:branched-chain amino acid ABC transporter permease [Anaerolineae bacterium]